MNSDSNLPIVLTPGEPAGIGAEVAVKAWENGNVPPFFLLDEPQRIRETADVCGSKIPIITIKDPTETIANFNRGLPVLPFQFPIPCPPGRPAVENAKSVIDSIRKAVEFIYNGKASGLVTNPVHKQTLKQSGFKYPGHTEFLSSLAGENCYPVMMLTSKTLRVIPVTIHEPINRVAKLLTKELIAKTVSTTIQSLRKDFGIPKPRVLVTGLNPHAGEGGSIGIEEINIIEPVVSDFHKQGINIFGPVAADSIFHAEARKTFDAAICMYHDQALIPIKTLDFWGSVNVTIGLPFIRTSPDHGTALDIAGSGMANPQSLSTALRLASDIAKKRNSHLCNGIN